jgi:hypothetical protein
MNRLSGDKDASMRIIGHIWAEENPHALFPRAYQEIFFINLWASLLSCGMSAIEISLHIIELPSLGRTF